MNLLATTSTANWLQDICISTPTHCLPVATAFNDVFSPNNNTFLFQAKKYDSCIV